MPGARCGRLAHTVEKTRSGFEQVWLQPEKEHPGLVSLPHGNLCRGPIRVPNPRQHPLDFVSELAPLPCV